MHSKNCAKNESCAKNVPLLTFGAEKADNQTMNRCAFFFIRAAGFVPRHLRWSMLILAAFFSCSAFAQQKRIVSTPEMQILSSDIAVSERLSPSGSRSGVDLYIRKKPAVNSVMLVETTAGKSDSYAYRAAEWNETNGDEIRYLDGKVLHSDYAKYSLISSTVKSHPVLGECFHIFIPNVLHYGYPWTRNGSVEIGKGVFVNIRTFEKPYGSYEGRYMDNPFMFDIGAAEKEPEEDQPFVLTDSYNAAAAEKFGELADEGNGTSVYSSPGRLAQDLVSLVDSITPKKKADIVFAVDTTGSMKNDMEILRSEWIPKLIEQVKEFEDLRVGLLFYRDYNDSYNYKGLPVKYFKLTESIEQFSKDLNTAVIRGNEGGDVPEAVYEAVFAAAQFYDWRKDAWKKIILIGDAEPHEKPKGPKKITKEKALSAVNEKNIALDCIIVPDEK